MKDFIESCFVKEVSEITNNMYHQGWDERNGGKMASEFPAHLMSHAARLNVNQKNRIVIHSHPTYTICMGVCLPTDDVIFKINYFNF